MALRFLLSGGIAAIAGGWYLIWLLPLVPYFGFLYYGTRGGTRVGRLLWAVFVAMLTVGALSDGSDDITLGSVLTGLVFFSFMFVLVVTTSKTVLKEQIGRAHV